MDLYKLLLCDGDGFLFDSVGLHYRAEMDFLREAGVVDPQGLVDKHKSQLKPLFGMPARYTLPVIAQLAGISLPGDFLEYLENKKISLFTKKLKPTDGVFDFLSFPHYRYCVVSSSSKRLVECSLDVTGIGRFIEAVFSVEDVVRGKPAPDIFQLAMKDMGAQPSECRVYDDAPNGIIGAKDAGISDLAGFCGGSHYAGRTDEATRKLLKAGAGYVFKNMAEVCSHLSAAQPELLFSLRAVQNYL